MIFRYKRSKRSCSDAFAEIGVRPSYTTIILVDPLEANQEMRELFEQLKYGVEVFLPIQDKELEKCELLPILRELAFNKEQEQAKRQAEDETLLEAKVQMLKEKSTWAKEYGSEHLNRGMAGGHYCQKQYIEERSAIEFPGFSADIVGNSIWGECDSPSLEALDLLDTLPGCKIVWLQRRHDTGPDKYGLYDELTPVEAIVNENYLGLRIDLIRYV